MTFVSTLGQALDQVERIKLTQLQLADFQTQIATGKKTQTFQGLGTNVIPSERAREGVARLDNYMSNIDTADRRLKMMVSALTQAKGQAEDVLQAIELQTQKGEIDLASMSDLARNSGKFIRDLLNQRDGDRYLFGGSETLQAPLGDTGTMDTYMVKQLTNWANPLVPASAITTDQLIDSYRNTGSLTDTLMGYSASLSSDTAKRAYVRVDDYAEIDYTVFADGEGLRDIVAAVNMLSHLDQVLDEVSIDPDDPPPPGTITAPGADHQEQNDNFSKFLNDLGAMMTDALDQIDGELYSLSQSQAKIANIKADHKLDQNIMKDTISSVEDADMNEVAVKLNALQNQLEASYRVTATISSLSIVNFLPIT